MECLYEKALMTSKKRWLCGYCCSTTLLQECGINRLMVKYVYK
jgi:hypothetical protein